MNRIKAGPELLLFLSVLNAAQVCLFVPITKQYSQQVKCSAQAPPPHRQVSFFYLFIYFILPSPGWPDDVTT